MKIIAFHLPQFHEIEENNKWWGEGFTEWTNLRKAKTLFRKHYQPRKPLNDFYYDLTDEKAREWQASIAQEHDIYAFCYYHYWFKGKKLLEKPTEEILKTKKPDMPFCFCWANESWTKRWDGKENHILIKQEYGTEVDWDRHYDYLHDFFYDERYIKNDNMPMLLIYRDEKTEEFNNMLTFLNEKAKNKGFNGIHFVQVLRGEILNINHNINYKAYALFEPFFTMNNMPRFWFFKERILKLKNLLLNHLFKKKLLLINQKSYDKFYKKILNRDLNLDKKTYRGAFVDWDNTPRRGYNGLVFKGSTPSKFSDYLSKLIEISNQKKSDYIFINAWNEWCESTYLEPDQVHGYQYLEAVRNAMRKSKLR